MTDFLCCFCGLVVDPSREVKVNLTFAEPSDEGQRLSCHASCLLSRLEPSIPVHPALLDLADE